MTAESKQPITNPTRIAVAAATKHNSGSFKPTGLTDIRSKMMEPLPEKSLGNILMNMDIETKNQSDMEQELFIHELKKKKMEIGYIKNIENAFGHLLNFVSEDDFQEQRKKYDDAYICSSMCRSNAYGIDFGWGKPIKATIAGNMTKNSFRLMDTPNEDGIEALVCLGEQDMAIIQNDPQLLAFC